MSASWPAAVWQSPWLKGLDAASRQALEAAGQVRSLERGASVFAAGDPADAFFVVSEGLVEVRAVRRGDAASSAIRRAVAGEAVGEEAVIRSGGSRTAEATCVTASQVAEVSVAVFRRVAARGQIVELAQREQRLRDAAMQDALRASSLARVLGEEELRLLLSVIEPRELSRGDVLFAQGDPARRGFVVADGMLAMEIEDDGKARVRAYLGRGDLVADGALEQGGPHEVTARASGPAWVLGIPREALLRAMRAHPGALAELRRIGASAPVPQATRHVMGDLWRFAVAGSMLVIDDEVCVRCGHCAWTCAHTHADGVSRLVRRGEKVTVRDASDGSSRALIVPGGCQQCKHPACMISCPTGAIGRDPRGGVFVREDLCVGCGQCERACPWGSVHMAPRTHEAKTRLPVVKSDLVAVKCDACRGEEDGPACIRACPVEAIARVEPLAAMADVRRAVGGGAARTSLPRARPAWPWVVGAAALAAGLSRVPVTSWGAHMISGLAAGAILAVLAGYAVIKRVRLPRLVRPRSTRPHAIAHLALGTLLVGAVAAHSGGRIPPGASGALLVAFLVASATGALAALAYALLPRALARVEREARLPEDLPIRARELRERTFGALTGRSDGTKALYARLLAPYASAPFGALRLIASRRTLHQEETHLRRRVARVLGHPASQLDGVEDLVRLVVERRAVGAQRLLQTTLRAWVPAHILSVAVALVLLVVHVACVAGAR